MLNINIILKMDIVLKTDIILRTVIVLDWEIDSGMDIEQRTRSIQCP